MKSTFKLFRIFGIEVGFHYTWIFIFLFFGWSLAQFFHATYATWSAAEYWITGIIGSLLIFVSVLLHELAHSLVARARGLPVHSITLFILGGVSNLEEEPKSASIEFAMAIVGPATSILIAIVCWAIASGAAGSLLNYSDLMGGTILTGPVLAVLGYLAVINLFLGIFNLLPGFPLDGGRVLRSIVWQSTGNLIRATNIAAGVGQFFGWLMITAGIVLAFTVSLFSGIWLAFIGWFLNSSADASRKEVALRERLSHVKVRDVVTETETIEPGTRVADLVNNIFARKHGRAVAVCSGGTLQGIVTISDVRKVPQDRWDTTTVADIMTRDPLYTVEPTDSLNKVLELIARHDINQVIVKHEDGCAGLLGRADVIRYLQFSQELGLRR
jgi:Zn-dependent protease/CBS domain-containing protein